MAGMIAILREEGVYDPEAILLDIARQALQRHPLDQAARHLMMANIIREDAELAWAFSAPYRSVAFDRLIMRVRERPMPARGGDAAMGATLASQRRRERVRAAALDARSKVTRLSILDRFKIDGRAVGDYTPRWLRAWAADKKRDARFVELIIEGRPDDRPLRLFTTADEADDAWSRAQAEAGY